MRILNGEQVSSHGNVPGRKDMVRILEAGLEAADPYHNTRSLLRLEGSILKVGNPRFEANGDPHSGIDELDLNDFDHVYVVGAGKGVQRVAKAIEDVLGDWLSGGEVISKHGDELILERIGNTFGAHPTPDAGCVEGAQKILDLAQGTTERDLVFTIIMNGGSSLLTLPYEGISIEDIRTLTRIIQIELGLHTNILNHVRNAIDQLKGGRLTRALHPAKMVHLIGTDANRHGASKSADDYMHMMKNNTWLHNLPDASTYQSAQAVLEKYDIVERCPASIREFIYAGDPARATVGYEEYRQTDSRFFGIMPDNEGMKAARDKASQLGYKPYVLTRHLITEAKSAAQMIAAIARNITERGEPFPAPVALVTTGEMLVTVNGASGVGGRSQEFCLAAAMQIEGSEGIVIGSVDTDGTDGPGGLALPGAPDCLGGAIVDGTTAARAGELELDLFGSLREHATSAPLWQLDSGLVITHCISTNDITVALVMS